MLLHCLFLVSPFPFLPILKKYCGSCLWLVLSRAWGDAQQCVGGRGLPVQGKVNFIPWCCPLFWSISQPSKLVEQLLSVQLVPAASRLLPLLCPLQYCTVQSVPCSCKLDHSPSRLVQRPYVCKVSGTSWVLCRKLISCCEQPVCCGSLGHIWLHGCGPPDAGARVAMQVGRRWSSEASDEAEMLI